MIVCPTFDPDLKFLCQRVGSWSTVGIGGTRRKKLAYQRCASERERMEKGEHHVGK